ncbi:HAMP domain-containing sensor histidine kinase [Streptomyces sp. BE20]|uniref:HAMP domain-containing sensor histidine kinase n=1 Tax=Streptomyces sp. BE20 TaxID=3002525 RepID=UPI002E78CADA|nr:HAMP domain-containing sensor histidine kinase [Streptomyces sp. BE20]MEE1821545.1 HAMP domain-containing sensor histidine kinase [Streptomyces sp. BE20]
MRLRPPALARAGARTGPGARTRGRTPGGSLTGNLVLLATVVATVAVLLAGFAGWRTARSNAEAQYRERLVRQAAVLSVAPNLSVLLLDQAQRLTGATGVQVAVIAPDGQVAGPSAGAVTPADRDALLAGEDISTTAVLGGARVLLEGRPARDGAVVLTQPFTEVDAAADRIRAGLTLPLVAGLVGAALAGALLARRIARPLVDAAAVAHRLAGGERDLHCAVHGPAEAREVARALNTLGAALEQSEGRQRAFLTSVSHEIRTPLTALRGFAEALADGVVEPGQQEEVGRILLSETERLDRFVTDLLELARLDADDFHITREPADLDALVRETARAWTQQARRQGLDLRLEHPDEPVTAATDAFRVRQLLDGLLANAVRHTPPGAPVVLALRRTAEGQAELQVRDGGPGLTEDDVRIAFRPGALRDRYAATRPTGTGLGLAIAQRLAERLGATLALRGHGPEGGAHFTVTLPGEG